MKHLSAILITMFILPAGCGQSAEASKAREKAGEALDAIGTYTAMELEGLATNLKSGWSDLKTETAKLKAEALARGGQLGDSIAKALAEADAKAANAKTRLAAAAEAGTENAKESWGHARQALDEAKAAVARAWEELRK